MQLSIDKRKGETILDQIVTQVKNLIDDGVLVEGYQMPSTRQLAGSLGVNRSTVVNAYEELWALGYVESSPGSYTKVRKRKKISSIQMQELDTFDDRRSLFNKQALNLTTIKNKFSHYVSSTNNDIIDFGRLEPDIRLIETNWISSIIRKQLSDTEVSLLGYSPPQGFEPLRRSIIDHMKMHYIFANDENILITNGSQSSLQLIFQAFINRNDFIVVERPTYSMVIPLIKYFGAKCIEVPVRKDGFDVDEFEKIIRKKQIKLVYVMPTFQNPTAISMSQEKREKLLSLCEKNGIIIVEDSIEEEMKYFGKMHLPIKSMDTKNIVIYLGTFSKILAPGLRTAWILAHKDYINQLTALKFMLDISSNTLSQVLLYNYCKSGYYEIHIRKMMRAFRKRMQTALKALNEHISSEYASWTDPMGGFIIWLKLEIGSKEIDIENYFLNYGVKITNGNTFFYTPTNDLYIRLSISKCNEIEIVEGIKRIAIGLKEIS